jgi:hypothetical protein
MTGTFQFSTTPNPVTPTAGTDASGNQTLTASVTFTPQTSNAIYVYYPGDSNYSAFQTAVPITVNIPDFSVNLPSSPLVVTAGQSGSMVVTIVPVSKMSSTVSLTCGGNAGGELPGGYTCSFSPASVNLNDGVSATSTFSLTPTAQANASAADPSNFGMRNSLFPNYPGILSWILLLSSLFAFTLLAAPVRWRDRRTRSVIFIFSVICFAVGCGGPVNSGGGGGTLPIAQPTTITVQTSAAKVAYATPLTFTATVTGSNHPTGSVLFSLNGVFTGSGNLIGNTAVTSGQQPWMGTYIMAAQYTGDGENNPSNSAGVNVAVTGTSTIGILGQTGTNNHFNQVTYTIQ